MAAPFATRQLADLGARVIKIERPDGGDFARGVRRHRQRAVQLLRLAEPLEGVADARPETGRRAGHPDTAARSAPTSSSRTWRPAPPSGSASPRRRFAAHGRASSCARSPGTAPVGPVRRPEGVRPARAERGRAGLGHRHDGAPSRVGISVADIAAGMYAYSGILTALLIARAGHGRRRRCRRLAVRRARRVDGRAGVLHGIQRRAAARAPAARTRRLRRTSRSSTRDGAESAWRSRTSASGRASAPTCFGRPDLADDPRFRIESRARPASRGPAPDRSRRSSARSTRRRSSRGSSRRHRVRAANDVRRSLSIRSSRRAIAGATSIPVRPAARAAPAGRDRRPRAGDGRVPSLGQHTEAILQELGFDGGHIARFRAEGTDLNGRSRQAGPAACSKISRSATSTSIRSAGRSPRPTTSGSRA